MFHFHFSIAAGLCIGLCVIFLIALVSYSQWIGEHTRTRWLVLWLGLALNVAGIVSPDAVAVTLAIASGLLIVVDRPAISRDPEEDDIPREVRTYERPSEK